MLAAWRYPLSGEMAFDAALAREFRIPQGWGLETGLLLESQRLLPLEHLCQVDLCARYDHRHKPLVAPSGGPCLADAAREILSTLLQSAPALPPHFHLHAAYLRHAERALQRSRHVARLNGLHFSELDERAACTAFLLAATGATV